MIRATWRSLLFLVGVWAMSVAMPMGSLLWAEPSKGKPEAGKQIYMESCQHCHGPTGKADTELAASLTPRPADLTAKTTQSKKDGQLRKAIVEGVPGTAMSAFGEAFDDQQMADVIAYIRSLKP
ncbi:c-type cytochrome [Nitrospira calida]|jgi:cytochrome c oxidase cbb3-type subunit 3